MARKYDASDIDVLESDRERVQKQAHIYVCDKNVAGIKMCYRELIDNANDECLNCGYDAQTDVTYDEVTQEITVKDNGRGIPLERLSDLCEKLNSSGKFSKGKDSAYFNAGGLNGSLLW